MVEEPIRRSKRPQPLPESEWGFPDPGAPGVAGPDDCVAVGADLEASTLAHSYRNGMFPWPHGRGPLPWFSPNPRGVLPPERLVVAKSLRQTLRRSGWTGTVDADFDSVIDACSHRPGREGTWITPAMKKAYRRLHALGFAHSVEVWDETELVGGLYGVLVGGVFTGESMFHRRTDASKVALVELTHRLVEARGSLVDVQLVTDHLASLGVIGISRPLFLQLLHELRDDDVRLICNRLPVARLAGAKVTMDPGRADAHS